MAGKLSPAGEKALKYIEKYPTASENSIAKKLHQDHPGIFNTQQSARNVVRWHLGKGADGRGGRSMARIEKTETCSRENPYGFPLSHALKREPFLLPISCNNILLLSDLHIPYHDMKALNCATKYGLQNKVNTIFINGDLLDCHQLSRFEKDFNKRSTYEEIMAAREFLISLRKLFPRASIYFHLGNHDMRYERFMNNQRILMKDLFGDDEISLESRLGLIDLRIHLVGDKQVTNCAGGNLLIHHGHFIFRANQSPVSPAKTIYDKMGVSMACGHTHKISEYTKVDGRGRISTCWSTGSLCELLPDYSPMGNNYAHGFAHIEINKDNTFRLRNFRINNGKIL